VKILMGLLLPPPLSPVFSFHYVIIFLICSLYSILHSEADKYFGDKVQSEKHKEIGVVGLATDENNKHGSQV
jgi:hypothetical protein